MGAILDVEILLLLRKLTVCCGVVSAAEVHGFTDNLTDAKCSRSAEQYASLLDRRHRQ